MSRIGNAPVALPQGVEVNFNNGIVSVKGKLGEMTQEIGIEGISIILEEGKIKFNDSTQNSTQEFYIDSSANLNDLNIDSFLTTLDSVTSNVKGFVRISKQGSSSNYIQFQISDVVDNGGWWWVYCNWMPSPDIGYFLRK